MSLLVYAVTSWALLLGTVAHTLIQQERVYPALVILTQEKVQLAVIYNFLLMNALLLMKATIRLFVGSLTALEVEHFMENGRSIVADTILFLIFYSPTIDNKEASTALIVQAICCLLVLKFFHAVGLIRVSRMFEIGVPSNLSIFRMGLLLSILLAVDLTAVGKLSGFIEKSSTFYTWLLFEFVNVSISSFSVSVKFLFNLVDTKLTANGWTAKSVYVFYTDLIGDTFQMTSYIVFMGVFFYQNPTRLPIYAIADVLQVSRQLTQRIRSFRKYREVTRNMDNRFPNATEAEIHEAESCIICRDKLGMENSKILNCSHIFHTECLKSWAVVQQSCPTCRADLVPKKRKENVVVAVEPPIVVIVEPPLEPPLLPQPETIHPEKKSSSVRTAEAAETCLPKISKRPPPISTQLSVPDEPKSQRVMYSPPHPEKCIWERPTADSPPPMVTPMNLVSPSSSDLVRSIQHAREMISFYRSQASFWTNEIRLLQDEAPENEEFDQNQNVVKGIIRTVVEHPPVEPDSMERIIDSLRKDLLELQYPNDDTTPPLSTETLTEWERVRIARRKKYEEELNKHK